MQCEILVTQHS